MMQLVLHASSSMHKGDHTICHSSLQGMVVQTSRSILPFPLIDTRKPFSKARVCTSKGLMISCAGVVGEMLKEDTAC